MLVPASPEAEAVQLNEQSPLKGLNMVTTVLEAPLVRL
jgi:hypothetical protein